MLLQLGVISACCFTSPCCLACRRNDTLTYKVRAKQLKQHAHALKLLNWLECLCSTQNTDFKRAASTVLLGRSCRSRCRFADAPNDTLTYGVRAKRVKQNAHAKQHPSSTLIQIFPRLPGRRSGCRIDWKNLKRCLVGDCLFKGAADDLSLICLRLQDKTKKEALIKRCAAKIRILDRTFTKGDVLGEGKGFHLNLDQWEEPRTYSNSIFH